MPPENSEGSECEGESVALRLPRSQSERLLAAYREHIIQERELKEKYHELVMIDNMCLTVNVFVHLLHIFVIFFILNVVVIK